MSRVEIQCPTCDGLGSVPHPSEPRSLHVDWPTCPECAGGGSVLVEQRISQPMAILAWTFAMLIAIAVLVWASSMMASSARAADEGAIGTPLRGPVAGWATWYDDGPGLYAAAGPDLREALGSSWRGRKVRVTGPEGSVTVTLSDWCACGDRHGIPTVIDLSLEAFIRVGDPTLGIVRVVVEATSSPSSTLPPTDTEPSTDPGTVGIAEGPGSRIGWIAVIVAVLFPGVMLVLRTRARR